MVGLFLIKGKEMDFSLELFGGGLKKISGHDFNRTGRENKEALSGFPSALIRR